MNYAIDTLLEFEENNPELFDFRFNFDDILIWPHFLRHQIFNHIIHSAKFNEKSLRKNSAACSPSKISKKYQDITDSLSIFQNEIRNFDIVIMTSARWKQEINGKFINPLSDYYALEFNKNSLILEDSYNNEYTYPRYYNNTNYITRDSIDLIVFEKAGDSPIHPMDVTNVENIIRFLKGNLPFHVADYIYDNIKKVLYNISVKLEYYYNYYGYLVNKVNPKLFFIHGASYTSKGYLIKWLKNWGIIVGEFQHCRINMWHPAYNYPESTFHNNEFKQYLPDYLLTFGQFWNDNIRHPAQKIVIGNPHLTQKVNSVSKRKHKDSLQKILIVSQPNMTYEFVHLTKALSEIISSDKYFIIYRLHPVERNIFNKDYQKMYHLHNVQISDSGDIYDYIYDVDHVVGCNSTVLYEAIAFNKPLYLHNTTYITDGIGAYFHDAVDLYKLIQNSDRKKTKNANIYWNTQWKDNYSNFIHSLLNPEDC